MDNYLTINKDAWNKRTAIHIESDFYNNEAFIAGKDSLNSIEVDLLGDVRNTSILHLQCHFGQDSLSLARKGANVVGLDLSEDAIAKAKELNKTLNLKAKFVCCDVYSAHAHISKTFDTVFTSYGVLGWLPNLDKWAAVVSKSLKPGGKLVLVEFHPVVWMMDETVEHIKYNYFKDEAIVDESTGTYTDSNAPIKYTEVSWNHSLSEVFQALKKAGMRIEDFKEYNYSPYPCFSDMNEKEKGKYQFNKHGNKMPLVYSIVALKQ